MEVVHLRPPQVDHPEYYLEVELQLWITALCAIQLTLAWIYTLPTTEILSNLLNECSVKPCLFSQQFSHRFLSNILVWLDHISIVDGRGMAAGYSLSL